MNTRDLKGVGLGGVLAATMALVLAAGPTAHAHGQDARQAGLVGTWRVQVKTYNCATGVENPAFAAYLTFGVDGTLVETTANPAFVAGQRSPGHGVWERTAHNSWRAVSEAFSCFLPRLTAPSPALLRASNASSKASSSRTTIASRARQP